MDHPSGLAAVEAPMIRTVLYVLALAPVAYVLIGLIVLTGGR